MMPSLYSGVSGLNAHQQRMNVIGNNVANVNTTGYKSSFITFKEAAIATSRSPGLETPGIQVGLGVNLSGITRQFSSGMLQENGQVSSMAVNGEGFFVVQDATGARYFTRAGDFVLDITAAGEVHLITSDGKQLCDSGGNVINLNPTAHGLTGDLATFSVNSKGYVTITDTTGASTLLTSNNPIAVVTFQNNNGLKVYGANLYSYTAAAGTAPAFAGGDNVAYAGAVLQGYLESSNTDLSKEFTNMILAQRGFQANAKTITTSDDILQELMQLKR